MRIAESPSPFPSPLRGEGRVRGRYALGALRYALLEGRMPKLTHFDKKGRAKMVDVSTKAETMRKAVVRGSISMKSTA